MASAKRAAKVCVLGGGGFLGSHLVRALAEQTEVVALDVDLHRLADLGTSKARLEETSIADPAVVEWVVEEHDLIVSTTAICNPSRYNTEPLPVIEANFTHLVPLVDLCAQEGRRLVHFSTCEVYGKDAVGQMNEDTTPLLLGPIAKERWTYACAKQLLERWIWARGHEGLAFSIVRPFNVIGGQMDFLPGVDGEGIPRVLACFMRALLWDEPIALVDEGRSRRSFIYIDDFTEAVMRILDRPEACDKEIINIGNPENDITIASLAERLATVYREMTGKRTRPWQTVTAESFYGPGYDDVQERLPDIDKARRLLDWHPNTTIDEMLPLVVADYVKRYGSRA